MKKIGKEVLFLKTGKENPRNGESSMVRLTDGRIMFVYTAYFGDDWLDHATARISACFSSDEGETWSDPEVILDKPEDAMNIMSPSAFRMHDGALGLVYLQKDLHEDFGVTCMPLFIRSEDEGRTWSAPVVCGFSEGYYCSVNDSVTLTKSGRIYVPASFSGQRRDILGKMNPAPAPHTADIRIAYSDDNGNNWQMLPHIFETPYPGTPGLFEPGIFEYENGDLWMYARTTYGHQYQSFSRDGGKTWSNVMPNFRFTSPDSPMRVKRMHDMVVAAFNPLPFSPLRDATELWGSPKRTPIVVSVSFDDGQSFTDITKTCECGGLRDFSEHTYLLEDDTKDSYCYPSMIETKDGFLVSYYHSDGGNICLNASKIVKIYQKEDADVFYHHPCQ